MKKKFDVQYWLNHPPMDYYKVLCFENGQPNFWIGRAESKQDAIKRADRHPDIVYDVRLLDEAIYIAESTYSLKNKIIKNEK